MPQESGENNCGTCPLNFVCPDEIVFAPDPHSLVSTEGYRVTAQGQPVCIHKSKPDVTPAESVVPPLDIPDKVIDDEQVINWAMRCLQTATAAQFNNTLERVEQVVNKMREPTTTQGIMRQILHRLSTQ